MVGNEVSLLPTENQLCVGVIRMKQKSCYWLMSAIATWRTVLERCQQLWRSVHLLSSAALPSAVQQRCSAYWLNFVDNRQDQKETKHCIGIGIGIFFSLPQWNTYFVYVCGLKYSSQGWALISGWCFKMLWEQERSSDGSEREQSWVCVSESLTFRDPLPLSLTA